MMRTLRGRLALALAAVAALSVIVTALVAFGLMSQFSRQEALRQLRRDAHVLAREPEDVSSPKTRVDAAVRLLRAAGDHVARVGPAGRIHAFNDPVAAAVAEAVAKQVDFTDAARDVPQEGTVSALGRSFAYVVVAVPGPRGLRSAVILARPHSLAAELIRPLAARVAGAGLLTVLVAVGLSALLARRLTGRVRDLSMATASIAAGDLSHRVPVEGRDEVAELAGRFNAMAGSLTEAQRREREFLASVSHELRTPITAIRGYAQALADGTAETAEQQAQALEVIGIESTRLERLVDDVVDLARLGAREFRLEASSVDLAGSLRDAAQAHEPSAREAGIDLQASVDEDLTIITDAARVRQIVSNLVENAIRVTPSGGAVRIAGHPEAGGVSIEVSDTGPGIAEADLPHVFERAYLWNAYRGARSVGTGLGLAIVRELTAALGGRMDVTSRSGEGTTFRLWLPARTPQPV